MLHHLTKLYFVIHNCSADRKLTRSTLKWMEKKCSLLAVVCFLHLRAKQTNMNDQKFKRKT